MENNFDENRVNKILETLKGDYSVTPTPSEPDELSAQSNNSRSFDERRVEEIMNVLRGTSTEDNMVDNNSSLIPKSSNNENNNSSEKEFSWPRFIGEKFTKGVLNLADMPQGLAEASKLYNPNIGDIGLEEAIKEREQNPHKPFVSGSVKSLANKAGIDIESQGDGSTPTQRIVGKGAEFAGSSLIPGGGLSGVVKNAGIGAFIGTETGALEELGVPEPIAGLASLATVLKGAPALAGAIKKTLNGTPGLSEAEKKVANYLQQVLGEEGVASVGKNISEPPNYSMTGYQPTTPEIANNPFISMLNRLRQGIPGTGLQKIAGEQNESIHRVSDKLSTNAVTSAELKESISREALARKAKRKAETEPLYTEISKDVTQAETSNIRAFLEDNKIAKGAKRKDLDAIEKLIKPSRKLTVEEEKVLANYETQLKSINNNPKMTASNKEQAISKLIKPNVNNPTVADLDEARQNINDMLKKAVKAGADNRVRQLKEAKNALDKDLEPFAIQKEVTQKYAELSKPVNDILQHPTLKNIPKSRLNEIFESLFTNKSLDNMKALKQVYKDMPEQWKSVQDATVEHLMNSIKNAGAEGSRSVLSSDKLTKFLNKHEQTLKEVFTSDQIKFLEELKSALTGRNRATTLGIENQSTTYGKLVTGTHVGEGFGSRFIKGATYAPHVIPKVGKVAGDILRNMLSNYMKSRESDVMAVLDNFLKNPEYAKKLLSHEFKSQAEFNKEMNRISKQIVPVASNKED